MGLGPQTSVTLEGGIEGSARRHGRVGANHAVENSIVCLSHSSCSAQHLTASQTKRAA